MRIRIIGVRKRLLTYYVGVHFINLGVDISIRLIPMLCFAFFFESVLIPVSKAFQVKDDNGAMGMRSSLSSLGISCIFYALIVACTSIVKHQFGDQSNTQLYLTIF
jgi:hypothetical protein